jgi:glycosyltransferase involved in cell wall biosynthesis
MSKPPAPQYKVESQPGRPGRPRIGIDLTPAVTQGGGIGRYTRELIQALVNLDDDDYHFHLFSARQPAVLPVPDPVPQGPSISYHQAPLSDRWLYRLWYRLRLPLPVQWLTGPLDLFHSPDFVLPPVKDGIPTLLTVHDLSFLHYPETFTPALIGYLNRVVPWSVARASHILADSQATRDDLINLWQVPPEKVTVLYSGVGRAFRPVTDKKSIQAVRDKYRLGDGPYLFSVSTLQPRKNYQMLIRAFQPLADKWPHNLIIAGGKGWLYETMLAEVEAQGLAGRVKFIGFADDADLPALYSAGSLYVFPSLYEGFGLTLLEAMACGLPVLSADASCLPEVAGQAAVLLSPHDQDGWTAAIDSLLADPAGRAHLVAAGFLQARQFDWGRAARQLSAIYRRLLAGG